MFTFITYIDNIYIFQIIEYCTKKIREYAKLLFDICLFKFPACHGLNFVYHTFHACYALL